jgi:hypothetical protein
MEMSTRTLSAQSDQARSTGLEPVTQGLEILNRFLRGVTSFYRVALLEVESLSSVTRLNSVLPSKPSLV